MSPWHLFGEYVTHRRCLQKKTLFAIGEEEAGGGEEGQWKVMPWVCLIQMTWGSKILICCWILFNIWSWWCHLPHLFWACFDAQVKLSACPLATSLKLCHCFSFSSKSMKSRNDCWSSLFCPAKVLFWFPDLSPYRCCLVLPNSDIWD